MRLTARLRTSLRWFKSVLERDVYRRVLYATPQIERLALLYTDAESSGQIAAVLIVEGVTRYWVAKVPRSLIRKLHLRYTQIVPFELIAAIMGILVFDPVVGLNTRLLHFIDARAALNIVLKGALRQADLNSLISLLWLKLCEKQTTHWAFHVHSTANLADGPSRGKWDEMTALSAIEVKAEIPNVVPALEMFYGPYVPEHVAW